MFRLKEGYGIEPISGRFLIVCSWYNFLRVAVETFFDCLNVFGVFCNVSQF